MAQIVACPDCQMKFQISDDKLGRIVRCKRCGSLFCGDESREITDLERLKCANLSKATKLLRKPLNAGILLVIAVVTLVWLLCNSKEPTTPTLNCDLMALRVLLEKEGVRLHKAGAGNLVGTDPGIAVRIETTGDRIIRLTIALETFARHNGPTRIMTQLPPILADDDKQLTQELTAWDYAMTNIQSHQGQLQGRHPYPLTSCEATIGKIRCRAEYVAKNIWAVTWYSTDLPTSRPPCQLIMEAVMTDWMPIVAGDSSDSPTLRPGH